MIHRPNPNSAALAAKIDQTLLKAQAIQDDVRRMCEEAARYRFAAVCVNPGFVSLAAEILRGTSVKPITVVGFPLGATLTSVKVFETREALRLGAREIDMVLAIGALKGGDLQSVEADIRAVVEATGPEIPVKVILETALLSSDEIVTACRLAEKAGAAFVKTSTGFGPGGATVEAVRLMKETVGDRLQVKASGGIRTHAEALRMIEAGADRIGTSSGAAIVDAPDQSRKKPVAPESY